MIYDKTLLNKTNSMSDEQVKKIVQDKSKYDAYIFNFNEQAQKDYYKIMLNRYKLYETDRTSTDNYGVLIYCVRDLKRKNESTSLSGYRIYSIGSDFISNRIFEELYFIDNVYDKIIENDEFDKWLNNFLIGIFGRNVSQMYAPRQFIYENIKKVKKFSDFLNEKKIPNLSIDIQDLLSVLDNNKTDIFRKFRINKDEVNVNDDIDKLYSNNRFNNNIKKNNLKKGKAYNTQYNETLLDDKYVLKFFFLYDKNSMELEEPEFIILQYYNTDTKEKSDILGFINSDNINDFYQKLTDATIELTKGEDTYIYQTSNGGNNWEMKNVQMEDDKIKGTLDKKELQELIDKNNLKIKNG